MILGVDPGASGAIAHLTADGQVVWVIDMPHHDGLVAAPLLADALDGVAVTGAWVEDVHAMPRQGVSSSFKFGRAHGTVLGVLGALRIPTHFVTPAKWKKAMRVTADKDTSRRRAVELWPDSAHLFARKKDNGRAEAALIARFGLTQMEQDGLLPPRPAALMPWDGTTNNPMEAWNP